MKQNIETIVPVIKDGIEFLTVHRRRLYKLDIQARISNVNTECCDSQKFNNKRL